MSMYSGWLRSLAKTKDETGIINPCTKALVRTADEIERLEAELEERDKQIESLQNKWASRELSQQDSDVLMAENERLREIIDLVMRYDSNLIRAIGAQIDSLQGGGEPD